MGGDKEADESFMRVLQKKCEDTAIEWDKRSVTRSSELTSIAKALEALETGVVPNWGANKKLVGLQKKQMKKTIAARDEEQGKLEGIEADITEKTAERKQLKMEIAELAEEIAQAMKALSEATE